jgi:3-phenylpropionate/trans-cinnamate dioxygenase ferredoxin subunit
MTKGVEVARVENLNEGEPTIFSAAGREIVLVRWRESVYAVRNICPHQSISFLDGSARDRVVGEAKLGDVTVVPDDPVLRCPRHAWDFSLSTGRCTADPSLRVKTYPTTVQDGRVFVEIGSERENDGVVLSGAAGEGSG